MASTQFKPDDAYRDSISTVDAAGKRVWLYPKKPAGRLYRARKWLSYGLLAVLFAGLNAVLDRFAPAEAAVEETFVNAGVRSALILGQARGVALLTPAARGVPVAEYAANLVKKSVVGTGHAGKGQVELMVRTLLPTAQFKGPDAADALAIAICHAHHRVARQRLRAMA